MSEKTEREFTVALLLQRWHYDTLNPMKVPEEEHIPGQLGAKADKF